MKKLIKLLILKTGTFIYNNNKSKVIYYHDVHSDKSFTDMSTSLELFKTHIEIIKKNGYKIVDSIKNENKEIEITFDDGFRGLYENFDFFIENNIPVKIFIITNYINKINYLSSQEIKDLISTGLVKIASHTVTHRNLDALNEKELNEELKQSKSILEDMFDVNINEICYPRGRFNNRIIDLSKKYGYKLQYSCLPGNYFEPFTDGVIKRNFVQHATSEEFKCHLKGGGEIFYNRYLKQHFKDKV